jgi:TolB-like protein/Flp pilus assembly protein TadD
MGGVAVRLLKEMRRRRVFRIAGLYVVAVWLLMQVADIVFPAWGIPDEALRYLLWAGVFGFPVALLFGWIYQVTPEGIRRTPPEWSEVELDAATSLRRTDYLMLSAFVAVIGWIVYDATWSVLRTPPEESLRPAAIEKIENSVAVLPFASLSGDPDHEYFADGISEEILNRLSAFQELKVIARTSSFTFKNSGYDVPRISTLLGVKYLLQGSVRRDGQQLRIGAQLVDQSGVQVWSRTFERELDAIFAVQEEIAEVVAASIAPQIVPQPPEERLPNLEAYEAYLTGREIIARREAGAGERAFPYYDRAIELDPEFAEPYAERAIANAFHLEPQPDQAERDLDRALALKPDLARAYAGRALLMSLRDPGSHAEREALLRRSLALDPNQVDAWNWLSGALAGQGREDEAEQALRAALRLDPLAPSLNANMAAREIARGDIAEAEMRLLRVVEAPQAPRPVYAVLIGLYAGSGRFVDGLEIAKRYVLASISSTGRAPELFGMILFNAWLGLSEEAEYWRDRNMQVLPDDPGSRLIELAILSTNSGVLTYTEALGQVGNLVDVTGFDVASTYPEAAVMYGELLALSGDHQAAMRVLEPLVAATSADIGSGSRARQALAWTYLQTGERDKAMTLLEPVERSYRAAHAAGRLREFNPFAGYISGGLAGYAMTTLLSGDQDTALERLEQAADAGWRGYYGIRPDPRWDAVRDEPRFQAVMATIKADIDSLRARAEAINAEDDFVARFDALLALQADNADGETRQ